MQPAVACPQRGDYEHLIHGKLPPSEVERLSQHLAACSSCAAEVQTLLEEDTLLSAIRGGPGVAATPESIPADLTRRLLALPAQLLASTAEASALLAPPQAADEIGRLAHYRILKVLGEGGMGIVFLAEDTLLSRAVALKTLKPVLAADPRHRQRFLREARAQALVEHDHIVPIYSVGEDRGLPWLAMPFLKGQSLAELLKRVGVLTPAQTVRLGAQVAKGLAAAHAAGLIHRDVKPANIWVEPEGGGRAKLLDFGLAREESPDRAGEEPLTGWGAVVGTPAFMAPEQALSEPLDARADLFSLGCVLYRAVTGQLSFQGQGRTQTPPAPHEVNPTVPRPLSALIMNLLAKDRSARPASAAAVAAALEALQRKPTSPMLGAIPVHSSVPSDPGADLDTTAEAAAPSEPPALPKRAAWSTRPRRRLLVAAVLFLALLPLAYFFGGTVIRIATNRGQLVIEVDDPKVEVTVKENGVVIQDRPGQREITLAAGEHDVEVTIKDTAGETHFFTGNLTLKRGDKKLVNVRRDLVEKQKPEPIPPPEPPREVERKAAEWVLSIGGQVFIRQDGQEREIKSAKEPLPAPIEFVHLNGNPKVNDAGLANLKGLTNLKELKLHYTQVGDAGLAYLKGLSKLKLLNLWRTRVSDAGLVHLKGLTNLKELDLQYTYAQVSNAGLEHLKGLTKLTQLRLSGTQVDNAGLEHLKGLTNLTQLWLAGTRVSDDGLACLKSLTNLTDLRLADTRVTDAGLVHLKELTKLRELELQSTKVGNDGLENLKGLTDLWWLDLDGTQVSDAGLVHLKGLTKLMELKLGCRQVTNAGLEHLKGLTDLKELRLWSTQVNNAGLVHLKGLTNLTELRLSETPVTDDGLAQLVALTNLNNLWLSDTRVSDAGLVHLKRLTNLKQLRLKGTRVSDAGLRNLINLPLTYIDLDNSRVSARGFAELRGRFPGAQIIGEPRSPAVEDLLAEGATLLIRAGDGKEDRLIKNVADLPRERFLVRRADCTRVKKALPALLARLGQWREYEFERLEALDLSGCALDDLGFATPLASLQELNLSGTKVADLQPLFGLKRLRRLSLDRTPITSLGPVAGLTELEELSLAGMAVTDRALQALDDLPNLRKLDLKQTGVTGVG
jgi:serine/threonine protein kinase/Leucine-rich repeat (LRR) protein